MQEVEAICDRVIILNRGKIVANAYLKDLTKDHLQIIDVEFNMKVEPEAFQAIDFLNSVKEVGLYQYELTFDTEKDRRSDVFDFAHDRGLKIKTLVKRHQTLEELFRGLTKG
jgi:ABC-2 type transport system ATP-binding protein